MKKLLFHFDTDPIASVFDAVVAYDSGIDHLTQLAGINQNNCQSLVEGAIFTRPIGSKQNTAIFIGGSNLSAGQTLLDKIKQQFFGDFRVSVMLDSNGCNTTAAAGIALINQHCELKGKTAVVLAGTGPVGQRAATMLALAGANVRITSRTLERAQQACGEIKQRFGVTVQACQVTDEASANLALQDVQIVLGTGKGGIQLLSTTQWQNHPGIEILADFNTQPPAGFEGIKITDKAADYNGKIVFGGLGIGALKLKLHKACIAKLFSSNDLVLDAEQIWELARESIVR